MSVGTGSRQGYVAIVGLAPEYTLGTHVTATSFACFNSESLNKQRTEQKLESICMNRDFTKRVTLEETVEGSIEVDLDVSSDFVVWLMAQSMGGTVAASTVGAGCTKHTIYAGDMENNKFSATSGTNTSSLSISVRKGGVLAAAGTATGDVYQFDGCRVNSLSIKGEVNGMCMLTAEIIGRSATLSSDSLTASFSTVVPATFVNVSITTGDSIGNLAATEILQSFEVVINNNLAGDTASRRLGTRVLDVLPPTRREVLFNVSQRWTTNTTYHRFNDNTATAFRVHIDTGVTAGAAGGNTTYSMVIDLPKCYLNSPAVPEIGDMGVVTVDQEWAAMYDSEQGYSVQMALFNGTLDYN